jgi:pseudaminic acid cytidylyltransferase
VNVAILPARGGSKRIPRKNVRQFAGRPMIAHSIECALRSKLFDRVIVSTDDEEISAVARQYGAQVPFKRPADLADDHTGTTDVVAHAVSWLHDSGVTPAAVCCIYPTAPFIMEQDLASALAILRAGGWQYVFSATTFAAPILRAFRKTADEGLEMFFPQHLGTRSQDLEEALHDAAQFYWGTPQAWVARAAIFASHSTVVRIPRFRVQDIDTEEDWVRAESMMAYLKTCVPRNVAQAQ